MQRLIQFHLGSLRKITKNTQSGVPWIHICIFSTLSTAEVILNLHENRNLREQKLISSFKHCSTMKDLKKIHAQIIQTGFERHIFVVGRIISFCAVSEEGTMEYAVSLFHQIEKPDGFVWNTMIRGFGRLKKPNEAFNFYKRMLHQGEKTDHFTLPFLIKICVAVDEIKLGKQLHCCSVKLGFDSHIFVRNTLIHMYAMFKNIKSARDLFDEMPNTGSIVWNTMIDGYMHCHRHSEALKLFVEMEKCGIEPDDATIVIILSACADLGALDFGRYVHFHIRGTGLDTILYVSNSLIDMYSKCGAIDCACEIFNLMPTRNVVSWNSMILGLSMHGHTNEALRLFHRMMEEGKEKPDDVTFLGVLCACSHGGLVEEGKQYFISMKNDYRINPTEKHYGCMVDLLGRAGLISDAYDLIQTMEMECNAIIWRALLAACRLHGNLELGEKVRIKLMELEPYHSGDYVLLANMYANEGRWRDAVTVREIMREKGVQKPVPGNSLITTNPLLDVQSRSRYNRKSFLCDPNSTKITN